MRTRPCATSPSPTWASSATDPDAPVRQAAAEALSAYGLLAEPAIPALKKATTDPDDDVKREAGRTLVHLAELKQKI